MEFLLHFRRPLRYKTSRADYKRPPDKSSCFQFLDDHASLDRFPEADLIRQNIADIVRRHHTVQNMQLMRQRNDTTGKRSQDRDLSAGVISFNICLRVALRVAQFLGAL